jgi:hypothetical protein
MNALLIPLITLWLIGVLTLAWFAQRCREREARTWAAILLWPLTLVLVAAMVLAGLMLDAFLLGLCWLQTRAARGSGVKGRSE